MNVMDAGLIRQWTSVQVVDRIFGSTFYKDRKKLRKGHSTWGTIDFSTQPVSALDSEATKRVGWYLAIQYDSNGIVQNYSISNANK
jgi:hypothetical protein